MKKTGTISDNSLFNRERNTPILNAARNYACSGKIPFHMPGHKLGAGLPYDFKKDLASIDLTELPGTDNLHKPEGIILEAQRLASDTFGSGYTFFLVNGSTCGIHAIISTICNRGDTLIVSRDCHKSVITGMILAGVKPVYIMPGLDVDFGITSQVRPSTVEKALAEHPRAAGVLLTRPNYYGVCCDLRQIAEIVHAHGKILAVDEAHGAHLGFAEELPDSAMASGADICVQSAHKTLPALTQGAYLHVGKKRAIDIDRLKFYLGVFQTSSPSYILMSSLDLARDIMQNEGRFLLKRLIGWIKDAKIRYRHENILCLEGHDPTRIVFNVRKLGITGFEAGEILRNKYDIQVEMADLYNVVCIAGISDSEENIDRLFRSFRELADTYSCPRTGRTSLKVPFQKTNPEIMVPYINTGLDKVSGIKGEKIALQNSAGRICLDIVAAYPPGVPVLCPGEIISEEIIKEIKTIREAGGTILGMDEDGCIRVASLDGLPGNLIGDS